MPNCDAFGNREASTCSTIEGERRTDGDCNALCCRTCCCRANRRQNSQRDGARNSNPWPKHSQPPSDSESRVAVVNGLHAEASRHKPKRENFLFTDLFFPGDLVRLTSLEHHISELRGSGHEAFLRASVHRWNPGSNRNSRWPPDSGSVPAPAVESRTLL